MFDRGVLICLFWVLFVLGLYIYVSCFWCILIFYWGFCVIWYMIDDCLVDFRSDLNRFSVEEIFMGVWIYIIRGVCFVGIEVLVWEVLWFLVFLFSVSGVVMRKFYVWFSFWGLCCYSIWKVCGVEFFCFLCVCCLFNLF